MKQLSFIDTAMLLQDSPRTPNHMSMVNVYDPSTAGRRPTFADVTAKIEAGLALAPTMRRRLLHVPLGLDRPYWIEDPDFDLEFHVRELALPPPGDWRQLRTQVARLHARPLDLTRPPWEFTMIHGLDGVEGIPPGCFATILKVHHAAIDGISGLELLNALHTLSPDEPVVAEADRWLPEVAPSATRLLSHTAAHVVTNPLAALRLVASNASPLLREVVGALRMGGPRLRVPRTRFNQEVSAHRSFDEARCTLGELKAVKATVPGATINDACISIIGGALRRYLDQLGELPAEPLLTIVPVSTRTPGATTDGGNQISMMRVGLGTDVADPIERLTSIAAETAGKKAAQAGVAMPVLLDIAQSVPGALIGAAVRGMGRFAVRGPVLANTIITNVPGSSAPWYLLGCKVVHSTGLVPLIDGIGLFHCISSYDGRITFMVTADRQALPDVTPYIACVQASIAEHIEAVCTIAA